MKSEIVYSIDTAGRALVATLRDGGALAREVAAGLAVRLGSHAELAVHSGTAAITSSSARAVLVVSEGTSGSVVTLGVAHGEQSDPAGLWRVAVRVWAELRDAAGRLDPRWAALQGIDWSTAPGEVVGVVPWWRLLGDDEPPPAAPCADVAA